MSPAEQIILKLCRARRDGFRTPGVWGMRTDVLLGGFGTTERVACAVLDLERTRPHPKMFGFSLPIILASGDSWEAVLEQLRAAGEVA